MSDRKLQQIDRRIADTLEELRILRVQADQAHEETMVALRDADRRSEERWTAEREQRAVEWAEIIEQGERRGDELRALRQVSDMKLAELREVSATNRIQTDALRLVLERIDARDRGRG